MPILQLPSNPSRSNDPSETSGDPAHPEAKYKRLHPIKVRTNRYGDLEEHELIHLLDSLDDERARAQFRESVYISTIFCLFIAWFLLYGPHVIFHQPYYRDPIAAMKQRDKELTYITPNVPRAPKAPPKIDRKTLDQLPKQARPTPPTPQPPTTQPAPQEQAHVTTPQPPIAPIPAAPKSAQPSVEAPLPAAPAPRIAQNSQSPGDAVRNAARGAMGRSGADVGGPGGANPLQAGATILSDTQGVDFSAYMRRLHNDIQRNWDPLIPQEVQPPLMKRGIVGIRFTILPDGQIGDIKLETTSGDVALDKAAWYAITSEGQFPPLPRQYHGPSLDLRVGFYYNTPVQQ
jgi:TonB family protein